MKLNKIIVCLSTSDEEREKMVEKLLIKFGFAKISSDARKIIASSPFDIDLASAYFVAAKTFNFRTSAITTQRLYEMALHGILVIVGAKKVPPEMEFMCEAYTITNFH